MQAKENQREAEADRQLQSSERKANKQSDKARQKAELDQSKRSYVWAIKFLKPYKKQIAALAACGTMAVIGETLTPKMIQYIIDHVVINKDTSLFIVILSALTAVNLLMLIAKNYRNLIQRTIGELASRDMQTAIFKHLRKLGFAHYERHPAGETLSMFNSEVASVQKIYRNYLPGVIDNYTVHHRCCCAAAQHKRLAVAHHAANVRALLFVRAVFRAESGAQWPTVRSNAHRL